MRGKEYTIGKFDPNQGVLGGWPYTSRRVEISGRTAAKQAASVVVAAWLTGLAIATCLTDATTGDRLTDEYLISSGEVVAAVPEYVAAEIGSAVISLTKFIDAAAGDPQKGPKFP